MLNKNVEARKHHRWNGQMGLYAKTFIPKGTIIGIFYDETVASLTDKEFEILDKKTKRHVLKYGCYYNEKWWINLDDARFINHSCDNNIGALSDFVDIAIKDIQKDEELTYDYSDIFHSTLQVLKCRCGSEKCRKIIRAYTQSQTDTKLLNNLID